MTQCACGRLAAPRHVQRTMFREEPCACGGIVVAVRQDTRGWEQATELHCKSLLHRDWIRRLAA